MGKLTLHERQVARDTINLAKKYVDEDPHLANYMLRALDATREAGLLDLSWALHRQSPHRNDVIGLIEHLERYLDNEEVKDDTGNN